MSVSAPLAAYGGLARVHARLDALPAARVAVIGHTVRGAPIHGVTIGPDSARRTTAILGGLHALEWIGVATALALVERLAAAPPPDRRIVAVPLINIDGFATVEADLAAGRRRFRRTNANGVDLNRNWPTHARRRATPRSEPEIAAVSAFLDAAHVAAPIDAAVSLHSIGRMLLIPWGGRIGRAPAHERLVAAARAVQRRLPEPYRVKQVSRWLPGARARGLEIDDLHARYGATALLVECTRGGVLGRWPHPRELAEPFRWYNPPTAEPADAIASALEPFARGE
jgi:hypothetical protein